MKFNEENIFSVDKLPPATEVLALFLMIFVDMN